MIRIEWLLAAVLISPWPAIAAERPSAALPSSILNQRAAQMTGMLVENRDGEKLGRIRSLIIEMPGGDVKYVIIASGGVLGVKSHLRIVPAANVMLATSKKRTACVEVNLRRWKEAPPFRKKSLTELSDPKVAEEIAKFYAGNTTRSPQEKNLEEHAGRSTGHKPAPHPAGSLKLVSEIIGRPVMGFHQEKIGDLYDLLVDLEGQKPSFGILAVARQSRKDYTFAVPLAGLVPAGNHFLLRTNRTAFDQASVFDLASWKAPATNGLYRFNVLEADNTGQNARDRNPRSLTAEDQSESPKDLQITRQLRQSLMGDSTLSFTAKNIKIITVEGQVTLKGPVKKSQEKMTIQKKAEAIAGATKVVNLLETEAEH